MEDYKEEYELGSIVTAKRTYNGEIITGEFGGFHLLNKSNPKSIVGVVHTPNGSYDVEPNSIESVISEDEKIRKEIISVVEQYVKICERESAPCDEEDITNWIAWLEKQGLQKQRKEWDADDLLNYNQIMHILQDCNQTELMDWLEKQSDKKSAEWSEEDKRMIDTIIYDLERHGGKEDSCYSAEINWLKSLKERMKG